MRKNFIKQSASIIEKNIRRGLKQWKRSCIDMDHSVCRGRGDLKTKAATYLRSLIEWLRRRRSTRQREGKERWENTRPSLRLIQGRNGIRGIWYLKSPIFLKARGFARSLSLSLSFSLSAKAGWGGSREPSSHPPASKASQSFHAAIKIRIIIISATAEWSVRSRTKRSSVSAVASPRRPDFPFSLLSLPLSLSFLLCSFGGH